jgi:hypothetical protein
MARQKNETAGAGEAAFEEGLMGSLRNAPNNANTLGPQSPPLDIQLLSPAGGLRRLEDNLKPIFTVHAGEFVFGVASERGRAKPIS